MTFPISKAACVGVGVIGAGWVARLVLSGVDVAIFDPSPQAKRIVEEVLANAARAYEGLYRARLPERGTLRFATSIADAVEDADFVQESVPERLDFKRQVLAEINASAKPDAIIGSSTSGLLPSDLQEGMSHPERLVVAHPFNPVYLLPLVEIVGGKATSPEAVDRARALYAALGMKPVVISREIEAFVGDRLLEALWREALWLVKDDVASVEEIDDVIRYSFGLRWAQMGLFQTYRIAGGEAGMRHFLGQFGPALKWPWTKLMDVPDLDEALVEKIATQSDEQAAGLSVRDLERIRDDNLVAMIRALSEQQGGEGWGAGALRNAADADLAARAGGATAAPLRLHSGTVPAEWIDYNGHMTEHRYLQVFGETTDALLAHIGVDEAYLAGGHSFYTVETHLMHLGEMRKGAAFEATTQILSCDGKRLHVFHILTNADGREVASAEQMLLHVDTRAGRAVPAEGTVAARVAELAEAHRPMAWPAAARRHVGQRRS
ncbi:carnitine 3-dehydrogenase [Aureimonas mangrovi]|uniref:carnitine 3-dehydrogenase n=1 Tax=Aureimonas mangrovi TaxID=2758041 RepID=UPI00163D3EAC|nr:carnitine 3-dehydrogenase [Aureimonas mangrovi]